MRRFSLLMAMVVLLALLMPVGVAAQEDGDSPFVLIAPGESEAESYWPVNLEMDTGTYETIIGGLFALLVGLLTGGVWFMNTVRKDSRDMLPPDAMKLITAGFAMAGMLAKMTPTDVDDQGVTALYNALGIEPPPASDIEIAVVKS